MKVLGLLTRYLTVGLFLGLTEAIYAQAPAEFFSDGTPAEDIVRELVLRGRCRSLIVIAPNMVAYVWITNGRWTQIYFFWDKEDRDILLKLIVGLDLNKTNLNQDVAIPYFDPGNDSSEKKLKKDILDAVEKARLEGKFECPISA